VPLHCCAFSTHASVHVATHAPALHASPAGHACDAPQTRQPALPVTHVCVAFACEGSQRVCPEGEHTSVHERTHAPPLYVYPEAQV
jgi:hypothetical protein